jgi:translation initiation factor IF-3
MKIILIGEDGKKIGDVNMEEAERIAKEAGRNLTMVAKNVYRIADAGKLKYERKQKQRKLRSNQRTHKIKEIKLGLNTDEHDIAVKVRRIREFLEKGLKTKITMQFKGRQMAFRDAGLKKMSDIVSTVTSDNLAVVDKDPRFEGRNLVVFLLPYKDRT